MRMFRRHPAPVAPPPPAWPAAARHVKILVEASEPATAWAYERILREAGYSVAVCAGPSNRHGHCPLILGGRCPAADDAHLILFALDPGTLEDPKVLDAHRRMHPDTPVCVDDHLGAGHPSEVSPLPMWATRTEILDTVRMALRSPDAHPELTGRHGSGGTATGRVRFVRDTRDLPEVEPGEIVVARTADPALTPIIAVAAGLVVDDDGADEEIVARELGVPTVVGTDGIETLVEDGDVVELEGATHRVRVVERHA